MSKEILDFDPAYVLYRPPQEWYGSAVPSDPFRITRLSASPAPTWKEEEETVPVSTMEQVLVPVLILLVIAVLSLTFILSA